MDYTKIVAKSVAAVPPSGIRRFFDIASEMEGVISLGVGRAGLRHPLNIRCGIHSIEEGMTHYTSNHGLDGWWEPIVQYMAERFNVHHPVEDTPLPGAPARRWI